MARWESPYGHQGKIMPGNASLNLAETPSTCEGGKNYCRCGYKSNILNLTSKTIALTWCRQCSDDKKIPEKRKEGIKKRTEKDTSPYTSSISSEDALVAKNKMNDLINDFKLTKGEENKKVKTTTVQKTQGGKKDESKYQTLKSKSQFDKKLLTSVKNVAQTIGGDKKETHSELIQVLKKFKVFQDDSNEKISLEKTPVEDETLEHNKLNVKNLEQNKSKEKSLEQKKLEEKMHSILSNITKVEKSVKKPDSFKEFNDLDKLGIFTSHDPNEVNNVELKIWNKLQNDELRYLIKSPPRNYYEELIQWTEDGKLWHFPIDNEQGMDEEAEISFDEHVFLDHHLEPWCPKMGPLRHFMELVLVGLSKNPFLTVKDKKEHIYWFRDYFESKRKVLTEVGAFPSKSISPE